MLLFERFYFRLVSELCIHRAYQILHRICHEKYWSYFHIASSFDDFIYQYNAHLSVFGCFSEVKWMINMSCIALAIFQPTPDTVHVIQTRQYFSQYNDSKKDDIAMNRLGVVQRPCQYLLWIYVTLSPFVISKSAVTSDALKTSSEMACYNLLRDPYFWEKLKFIRILWKSLQIGITASFFKKKLLICMSRFRLRYILFRNKEILPNSWVSWCYLSFPIGWNFYSQTFGPSRKPILIR